MSDEQFDYEMNVISNLKEVGAPNFNELAIPLKPILVICALALFLFINNLLLKNNSTIVNTNSNQEMEAFAASYDQTISN